MDSEITPHQAGVACDARIGKESSRRNRLCRWGLLPGLLFLLASPAAAQRRDVVFMKNGDTISGEIKRLERGQLYIDTPYTSDAIPVDWLQVDRIQSTARYQIELDDGRRMTGTISKVSAQDKPDEAFRVEEAGASEQFRAERVVWLSTQKANFWRQLKGSVDYGFNFTSGNQQTNSSLGVNMAYDSTRWSSRLNLNSSFTGQTGAEDTNRQEINSTTAIYLSRHSFLVGLASFLTSSQQDLDLRTTLGGGYGRYFIRNNTTNFNWAGGVVFTKEQYDPTSGLNPKQQSVEGLLALSYSWYRFNKYEFTFDYQVYPGFSDTGRVRSNLNQSFSVKLVRDLYWRVGIWDTFDSKPPVSARRNEFGISSSFGWKF